MNRTLIIILTLVSFVNLYSQEGEIYSCESRKKDALNDFYNGIYVLENYHSNYDVDYKFERYYELYLESKYNIKTITTGCIIISEESCYINTIDSLLERKYGDNFFKKNRIIQNQKFKKLKNREKANVLNDKKFYDHRFLEEFPEFNGNKKILRKYFEEYFEMENINKSFGAEIQIDLFGNLVDIKVFWPEILRDKKMENKETVIKELNEIGKWKSGRIYNEKVNSIFMVRI